MAQRIVRAKRKIVVAGIPLTMPSADQRAGRLDDVLTVTYLMFNEAYVSTSGDAGDDRDLGDDAAVAGGPGGHVAPPTSRRRSACWRCSRCSTRASPPGSTRPGRWCCSSTRTARCGTGPRSRRGRAARAGGRATTGPAASSSRPRSPPATRPPLPGRTPTGCRSWCSTTCCWPTTPHRSPGSTAASRSARCGAPRGRPGVRRPARPARSRATTCSTRPGPPCSGELGRDREADPADARALTLTRNPAEQLLLRTRLSG